MTDKESVEPPLAFGRYPVGADGDGIWIDLSRDDGGWSGCGHPHELFVPTEELEAAMAAVKARRR